MPSIDRLNTAARTYGPLVNLAVNVATLGTLLVLVVVVVVESRRLGAEPEREAGGQVFQASIAKPLPVLVVRGQLDVAVDDWNVGESLPVAITNEPSVEITNLQPVPVLVKNGDPIDVDIGPLPPGR